jgi:aspartate dehydrogenase
MPGFTLACAAARDHAKAQAWLDSERIASPLIGPAAFPARADLAVECTPAPMLERICPPMLEAGKQVTVLSAGALLPRPDLIELAKACGGQIIVPSGALLGVDAVAAAAEGRIHFVRLITCKPPRSLMGAPHPAANSISVEGLNAPKLVFCGTARDAAAGFPTNVNVGSRILPRTIPEPDGSPRSQCWRHCSSSTRPLRIGT